MVHDLNAEPALPFADGSFDAVVCCVSVDYLVRPVEVFGPARPGAAPGGRLVLTFSNRCFPTKAIRAWLITDDAGHVEIVREYFGRSGAFAEPTGRAADPLGVARRPALGRLGDSAGLTPTQAAPVDVAGTDRVHDVGHRISPVSRPGCIESRVEDGPADELALHHLDEPEGDADATSLAHSRRRRRARRVGRRSRRGSRHRGA